MDYIKSGQAEGATLHLGGKQHGTEGYFLQSTIFTNCKPHMKIVQEEIFGPVAVVIKFTTEEGLFILHARIYLGRFTLSKEVIEQANNTTYGLACSVFTKDIDRAMRVAGSIEAGTAWASGKYCFRVLSDN